jgi:hypothetical protein
MGWTLLTPSNVIVYLLCFIRHRYQKLHDNLIQSMLAFAA